MLIERFSQSETAIYCSVETRIQSLANLTFPSRSDWEITSSKYPKDNDEIMVF